MPFRVSAAGNRAVLIELVGVASRELHAAAARVSLLAHVSACVTGQQSLYVIGDPPPSAAEIERALEGSSKVATDVPRIHQLRVSFAPENAPDLPALLARAGVTIDTLLERVADLTLRARFLGFRAGYAYLDGWPEQWQLPRRETARPRVPRGSFATAGAMAGFYAADSPGGWNLIGLTDAPLWSSHRQPPALIAAGDEVRITPTLEALQPHGTKSPTRHARAGVAIATVVQAGQNSIVVREADEARLAYGIAAGGPFDREAAASANLLAGNVAGAPVIECVLVGPALLFESDRRVAWNGAPADLRVDGAPVASGHVVRAGQTLTIGRLSGLRGWLAIEGGVDDGSSRFEPMPQRLLAKTVIHDARMNQASVGLNIDRTTDPFLLRAIAGPHEIPEALLRDLRQSEWEVTPLLDRVGIRLRKVGNEEVPGEIAASGALPSIGAQFGSVQWHPDGMLVILGPDHPVTGGYIQPFTLRSDELWKTAQLAPGARVRFAIES